MSEEYKQIIGKKCLHPRVKEVLEEISPPSPMIVPRDKSQPRAGNLLNIHKEILIIESGMNHSDKKKPQVVLNLDSCLLRRRKPS
jgi:hypothetical protein